MLGAAGCTHARGQKTFLLNLYRLIDTQGRGVHGPDERGLERLFIHNVKLYNCAAGLCGTIPNFDVRRIPPDGACKDVRNGWRQMVNII